MKTQEFIFWLRGYLKALTKDANINKVISDIVQELTKVDKEELPHTDKETEKLTEDWWKDWIKKNPPSYYTSPTNVPFPIPQFMVMCGCPTNYPTYTQSTDNTNKTE